MKTNNINTKVLKVPYVFISLIMFYFVFRTYLMVNQVVVLSEVIKFHNTIRIELAQSLNAFTDYETSTRGYILVKDPLFLSSRDRGFARLRQSNDTLKVLLQHDPFQSSDFTELLQLYSSREQEISNAINSPDDLESHNMLVKTSADIIEKVRMYISSMTSRENAEIINLTQKLNSTFYRAPSHILVLIILIIFFFIFSYLFLLSQIKKGKLLQAKLSESNDQLKHSQNFLESIINSNVSSILVYKPVREKNGTIADFKLIFAKGKILTFVFQEPENVIGKLMSEIYPSLKETDFQVDLIEVMETGNPKTVELYYPDDGFISGWFNVHIMPFNDGILLNVEDYNQRKLVEFELKNTIEQLNLSREETELQKNYAYRVFESLPMLMVTIDKSFIITYANEMFLQSTKSDRSLIGKNYKEVFGFNDEYAERIFMGEEINIPEFLLPTNNKYYNVLMVPIRDKYGLITGLVIISRDVDALIKTQQENTAFMNELKKSNERLKQFTFISSHDLQEPLRKIQTYANRILSKSDVNSLLRKDVEKMKDSSIRLAGLIESINQYSMLQINDTHLHIVDLNKLLEQVLSELDEIIKEKNAIFDLGILPIIKCDPGQIKQLFHHLVSNALKFNRSLPYINIFAEQVIDYSLLANLNRNFEWCQISFQDNGIGFNEQYSTKLFSIFQKLHNSKEFPGTGIGLSMCKQIVENHKGFITAYSTENIGSTFIIYLPINLALSPTAN